MSAPNPFRVHEFALTIRYPRGYRYLDRCGQVMLQLETTLQEGWLVAETTPKSGNLRHDSLGMGLAINTTTFACRQNEFISRDAFFDQSLKAFQVVTEILEIDAVLSPSLRVTLEKGYPADDEVRAEQDLIRYGLFTSHPRVTDFLGGPITSIGIVETAEVHGEFWGVVGTRRRRLEARVIRQVHHLPYDERLLARAKLLPARQREALAALMTLRTKMPPVSPIAIQVYLESTCEGEFPRHDFDLPEFMLGETDWAESFPRLL